MIAAHKDLKADETQNNFSLKEKRGYDIIVEIRIERKGGTAMTAKECIMERRSVRQFTDTWQMFDAGVASQSFCLAAYEQGIGSVIVGIFDGDAIAELLQIPADRELVALIPVGYPDESPIAPRRKPVTDLLSYIE